MPKQNRKPGVHLHKGERKIYVPDISKMAIREPYWYWILIAKNGKTIARSSETYKKKGSAVKSIVVAADIMTGIKPREYYDHTRKDGGNWVEF